MIVNPSILLDKGILTGILDRKKQLQPNGVDITVKKIFRLYDTKEHTCLLSEEERILPLKEELHPNEKGFYELQPNEIYDVLFNEYIELPIHMSGDLIQRSTLNRCGAFFSTGVYDSGYTGGIGAILRPNLKMLISQNCRLAQFVCTYSDGNSLYNGRYNEKKKED